MAEAQPISSCRACDAMPLGEARCSGQVKPARDLRGQQLGHDDGVVIVDASATAVVAAFFLYGRKHQRWTKETLQQRPPL